MEHWFDIRGYEGKYRISSKGRVYSVLSEIYLKGDRDRYGYIHFSLLGKHHTGHRLVATHFIPTEDYSLEVNHIDGDKTNNCIENLEWVTQHENRAHAMSVLGISSKGINNPSVKLSEVEVRQIKDCLLKQETQHSIAKKFNISRSTISMIAIGHIWNHIQ